MINLSFKTKGNCFCQFPHVSIFVHKGFFTRQLFYLLTNFSMKYILDCSFSTQRFYYHQPENKFDFFFVSSSLCKGLRHEEISDRFLSVSPLLRYRGKTIESHCLDDDSALKKEKSLFSLDSFYDCDCGVPSRKFCELFLM